MFMSFEGSEKYSASIHLFETYFRASRCLAILSSIDRDRRSE